MVVRHSSLIQDVTLNLGMEPTAFYCLPILLVRSLPVGLECSRLHEVEPPLLYGAKILRQKDCRNLGSCCRRARRMQTALKWFLNRS